MFFNQKTAYEMRISDWSATCALPIYLALGVAALPVVALVDDRVDGDGGLAGLPVADDQLALAAADGGHGVDGLDAGLQRLVHRLALDDARRQIGSTSSRGREVPDV